MANRANNDGVFKRKDRPGFWISWFDAQGRRRFRKTNAATLAQARAARSAEQVRVEQAKTVGFMPPGEDSFSEVAVRFVQHQKARLTPKSYLREKLIVEQHLKPFFPGKLATIRRMDVQRYVTARFGTEVSAHSVLKELNVLKHLLRLAVEWELIPINPAQGVKSPRVPAGRVRYLQKGELGTVLSQCPEWLTPIVALAVATGMRRSEILGLRWLDIDLSNGRAMLHQTKNGEGRIVYLNRIASDAIGSLSAPEAMQPTALLFAGMKPEQVSMSFARA